MSVNTWYFGHFKMLIANNCPDKFSISLDSFFKSLFKKTKFFCQPSQPIWINDSNGNRVENYAIAQRRKDMIVQLHIYAQKVNCAIMRISQTICACTLCVLDLVYESMTNKNYNKELKNYKNWNKVLEIWLGRKKHNVFYLQSQSDFQLFQNKFIASSGL